VVTTQDEEIFWIFNLVGKEKANCLKRLLSSINVISQEKVVSFWWKSTIFKQAEKIVILTVDIAAYLKHQRASACAAIQEICH
jgi:hypothetical protein